MSSIPVERWSSAYKDWYDAQWVSLGDAIGGFTEGQQLKSKNPPPPDLPEEPTDTELLRKLEALGFQRGKSVYFKSISEIMSELNSPLLLLLED
jgi:hypothetical protein